MAKAQRGISKGLIFHGRPFGQVAQFNDAFIISMLARVIVVLKKILGKF